MSLAALGCNPSHRWTVTAGIIGGDNPASAAAPGAIAYSPDGGLFVCVRAGGIINPFKLISIEAGFQANERDAQSLVHGVRFGASTEEFAAGEYGWLQVWGVAALTAGGAITAGVPLQLDAGEAGDVVPASANEPEILGLFSIGAIADNAVGNCQLTFPVNLR